jgi:predicted DNA repair protein MutK
MPWLMTLLMTVGTAAMIWVGGNIVLHGLAELGWHAPYDWIHHQAEAAAHAVGTAAGFVAWAVTAFFDGIFGLAYGLVLIPVVTRIIQPLYRLLTGKKKTAH